MPDRVIRDELLESDRWLDLPTDAARVAFVGFLLVCDDFGNFEGGRRLYRLLVKISKCETETDADEIIHALEAADLIREYEAEARQLYHIPRFRPHRQYLVRKVPASPWDDDRNLGKNRAIVNRGHAKNQQDTENLASKPLQSGSGSAEGVGVGVGVGIEPKPKRAARDAPFVLPDWIPRDQWDAWVDARTKRRNPPTNWAKRLAVSRLEELRAKGYAPAVVLAESAFNGWAGLFEPRGNK